MTDITDIHSLDQYIGRYVDLSEDGEGMAGFLVDVCDDVDYVPHPVRSVSLDYGYGMRVSENTVITTPDPPEGETAPRVENPVQIVHAILDGRPCSSAGCANRGRALLAVRAMRVWRMRQTDAYWQHAYVSKVRGYAKSCIQSAGEIAREARDEGAPPHILEMLDGIIDRERRADG